MASAVKAAKKVKNHVDESLEKVRAKTWAEPLGKTLEVSSKIVNGIGAFVPGVGVNGGALSFGATLLNPAPSPQELKKELLDIKELVEALGTSMTVKRALTREQKEIEEKLRNPEGEIRTNFEDVKMEMKEIHKMVRESNIKMSADMNRIQDKVSKTYSIVTDSRYRVSFSTLHFILPKTNPSKSQGWN